MCPDSVLYKQSRSFMLLYQAEKLKQLAIWGKDGLPLDDDVYGLNENG